MRIMLCSDDVTANTHKEYMCKSFILILLELLFKEAMNLEEA